jgi:hypothetical protein
VGFSIIMFKSIFGDGTSRPTPRPIPRPSETEYLVASAPPSQGMNVNNAYNSSNSYGGGGPPQGHYGGQPYQPGPTGPPQGFGGGRGPRQPPPWQQQQSFQQQGPPPSFQHAKDSGPWNCSACTFANDGGLGSCSICGTPRPGLPPPAPQQQAHRPETGPRYNPMAAVPPSDMGNPNNRGPTPDPAIEQLRQNVRNNSQVQQSVNGHREANVHTSVVFPNGEYFEKSVSIPLQEVESRVSSLLQGQGRHNSSGPNNGAAPPKGNSINASADGSIPRFDPATGFENIKDSYKESLANAGVAGGERVQYNNGGSNEFSDARVPQNSELDKLSFSAGAKKPQAGQAGRHQLPRNDAVTLADRKEQLLKDSGGARVNQPSQSRLYSLENYEKSVYIDPERHTYAPKVESKEIREEGPNVLNSMGVPVEVAAVNSKIRNIHRVAGERVKEMDHFVASVTVPVVRLALTDGDNNNKAGNGKLITKNDIGTFLQASFKKTGLEKSVLITVPVYTQQSNNTNNAPLYQCGSVPFSLMVEGQYCTPNGNNLTCPDHILRYASIFCWLLEQIFGQILMLELSARTVQLYYMTTVRADELVCALSRDEQTPANNGRLFLNVLVFQQSLCCDLYQNDDPHLPTNISGSKLKEIMAGWLNRITTAIYIAPVEAAKHEKQRFVVPNHFRTENNVRRGYGDASNGLYDKVIRKRFYDVLLQFSSHMPNGRGGLSAFEEGLALMTVAQNGNQAANINRCEELFSRALAESREKDDEIAARAAEGRLQMLQELKQRGPLSAPPASSVTQTTPKSSGFSFGFRR